jgi:hypothetical protein
MPRTTTPISRTLALLWGASTLLGACADPPEPAPAALVSSGALAIDPLEPILPEAQRTYRLDTAVTVTDSAAAPAAGYQVWDRGGHDRARTFLRFAVETTRGRARRAILRLPIGGVTHPRLRAVPVALSIAAVTDDRWDAAMTWSTRAPFEALDPGRVIALAYVVRDGMIEVDVTGYVNARLAVGSTVSFELFTDRVHDRAGTLTLTGARDAEAPTLVIRDGAEACERDQDGDGTCDELDVCRDVVDYAQRDLDRDGQGDACDFAHQPRVVRAHDDASLGGRGADPSGELLLLGGTRAARFAFGLADLAPGPLGDAHLRVFARYHSPTTPDAVPPTTTLEVRRAGTTGAPLATGRLAANGWVDLDVSAPLPRRLRQRPVRRTLARGPRHRRPRRLVDRARRRPRPGPRAAPADRRPDADRRGLAHHAGVAAAAGRRSARRRRGRLRRAAGPRGRVRERDAGRDLDRTAGRRPPTPGRAARARPGHARRRRGQAVGQPGEPARADRGGAAGDRSSHRRAARRPARRPHRSGGRRGGAAAGARGRRPAGLTAAQPGDAAGRLRGVAVVRLAQGPAAVRQEGAVAGRVELRQQRPAVHRGVDQGRGCTSATTPTCTPSRSSTSSSTGTATTTT